jgi:hypothetical protein
MTYGGAWSLLSAQIVEKPHSDKPTSRDLAAKVTQTFSYLCDTERDQAMATRRTFLGWLTIIGAAIVAVPLRYISSFRRARNAPTAGKAMLVTGDTFIEALAELADSNDPASIRLLIDSALQYDNSYFPPMPDEIEEHIKSTLVRTEVAYRQSRGPALNEQSLADTCNLIVARLGLPEPALTSPLQLRLLRMQHAISLPKLMEMERIDEAAYSMMSPLQAAVVVKSLIVSKRGVPWYWAPPVEWDATRYEEGMRTLRQARETLSRLSDDEQQKTNILKAQLAGNANSRDILSAQFRRNRGISYYPLPVFSSLESTDQMNLVNKAFSQLKLG